MSLVTLPLIVLYDSPGNTMKRDRERERDKRGRERGRERERERERERRGSRFLSYTIIMSALYSVI